MPGKNNSYQRLFFNKTHGEYYDKTPQKVLIMQDPYNISSYCTTLGIQCKEPTNNFTTVLENYKFKLSKTE